MLGIMAAVKSHRIRVELYHPNAAMREILHNTHLDSLLHVRHETTASPT